MSKYKNTKIYMLKCKDETIPEFYIGSTTLSLCKRYNAHRSECNNIHMATRKVYAFINTTGGIDNWYCTKLENYPCSSFYEQRSRERLYYEILEPSLNTERPSLLPGEKQTENILYCRSYYATNKLDILDEMKTYYKNNRIHILDRVKNYYELNKDKIQEYRKKRRLDNIEKIRQYDRDRYKSRKLSASLSKV